jgi:hypothetical protein
MVGEVEGDVPAPSPPAAGARIARTRPIDKRVGQVRNDGPELRH